MKRFISVIVVLGCCAALSACSSSKTSDDGFGDEIPSADAGTDAVPSDSAEAPPASTPDEAKATTDAPEATPPADAAAAAAPPASDSLTAATTPTPEASAAPEAASPSIDAPVAAAAAPAPEAINDPLATGTSSDSHTDSATGTGESHTVHRGDTLMRIAFEAYGDLYKWRTIYEANRDKIQDPNVITTGTVLTIPKSTDMASNTRNGEKYQIKKGDTLGTISNDVYGTPKHWKKIWDNNRELIKDPNRIFAGFYLYYAPSDEMHGSPALGHQEQQPDQQPAPVQEQPAAPSADARAPAASVPATN